MNFTAFHPATCNAVISASLKSLPRYRKTISVLRRADGVWEARDQNNKIVAYFGDEFAKALALDNTPPRV